MNLKNYKPAIGLEIHVQLKTSSKLFSPAGTQFSAGENQNTTAICWGYPGTLPRLNRQAVQMGIRLGLAMNCEISTNSVFARKNYFYPDLPKGYQISQYDQPLCRQGSVEFLSAGIKHKITIQRAHLEEDAGKSTHAGSYSLVDYNRAGMPLLEIVTGPDMTAPQQAADFVRAVHRMLLYLDVSEGNLEEGSLRCDCNVSVRSETQKELGTKVEIKNINSFRFIEKAIEFEIFRQIDCIESGIAIQQETRLYDVDKNKTFSMRSKEQAHDYRYFPDPDILPVLVEKDEIASIKSKLPELPLPKRERFIQEYSLTDYDADLLTDEVSLAAYFEEAVKISKSPKTTANWILSELQRQLKENKKSIGQANITAVSLGELVSMIESGDLSGKLAKQVFLHMWKSGNSAKNVVEELGLKVVKDSGAIESIVDTVIAQHPEQFSEYKAGKDKVLGFLVGQVMRASKGQADPQIVNEIFQKRRS